MKHAFKALLVVWALAGCAVERPLWPVLENPSRLPKERIEGNFFFLKTVTAVQSPSKRHKQLAPGVALEKDRLVRWVQHEDSVQIVSLDPLYQSASFAQQSRVLASFPCQHVDVLRKRTPDGDDTHEEEETTTRNPWRERQYVLPEFSQDHADELQPQTRTSALTQAPQWDAERGALNFEVERLLDDGTLLRIRYSLLRHRPSKTYIQRPYSLEAEVQYGLFHTDTFAIGPNDMPLESRRHKYINRWDTSKSIVFYFAPGFPSHLKPLVRKGMEEWAAALKKAVGDPVLEPIRENTGQALGDLRYNLIAYDDSDHSEHGMLGYAPVYANPRTGEILKADVVLFGRVLQRALFQEAFWDSSHGVPATFPTRLSELTSTTQQDLHSNITRLDNQIAWEILRGLNKGSYSEIEVRVFRGLFGHEFGHTLGLGHNFMASADAGRFREGEKTTSIMDYGFLRGQTATLGPYDEAALLYAYSPRESIRAAQLNLGYLYCSDRDVFSARLPLCQLFDAESSLASFVTNQLDRYFSSYEVNNLRLDRIDFERDSPAHDKQILSLLLPLRQIYDNATAILQAHSRGNYNDLWQLARQRIEARGERVAGRDWPIQIPAGTSILPEDRGPTLFSRRLERVLDRTRVAAVVEDARHAKTLAIEALRRVILDTRHPLHDQFDAVTRRLQVRGVLPEKLLALTLISAPLPHPVVEGLKLSPYSMSERIVPDLFASLISNTKEVADVEGGEPFYRIAQYDISLRQHALKLLSRDISEVGHSPEARELIRVQALSFGPKPTADPQWTKYQSTRTEFREYYRTLLYDLALRGDLGKDQTADFSFSDVSPFERNRNTFETAFASVEGETTYSAPIKIADTSLKTASGLLIRNNLNVAEDYLEALSATSEQLRALLKNRDQLPGRGPIDFIVRMTQIESRREALRRYVTGEQLFLQQIYLEFTRQTRAAN